MNDWTKEKKKRGLDSNLKFHSNNKMKKDKDRQTPKKASKQFIFFYAY